MYMTGENWQGISSVGNENGVAGETCRASLLGEEGFWGGLDVYYLGETIFR